MSDTETYTSVPIVRKLIDRKIGKLQEVLRDRLRCLNEELDSLEEEFSRETEKEELELQKLQQYRINTIEIFHEGDKQLDRIEEKIEHLKQRLESRKIMLEWDDTLLNKQLITLGSIVRMEPTGGSRYEWLEAVIDEVETTDVKYEEIDDEFLDKIHSFKTNSETEIFSPEQLNTLHSDESVVKETGIKPGEYLKPMRCAPFPPGKRPPPPPVPVPQSRGVKKYNMLTGAIPIMKTWKSKSFESIDIETEPKSPEPDLYCKVPDGKHGLGALRKKSNSLGGKLNLLGMSNKLEYKATGKCQIGSGPGQILKPKNVAISDKTGCIFVVEKGNNRVQVFAGTGDPMYSITKKSGSIGHAMVKPYGICVLSERVFVSVSQFSCLQVYKTNGEFILERGSEGRGEGQFVYPTGMNTDGTSKVYVCDYGNNRVQVFSKDLHFKQLIGKGNLQNPTDIAVDRDRELDLFVVDRSTTIVHQFSSKGQYKRKVIKIAMFPILSNPQYIAISPKGNLVLSDLLTNSVNIFSQEGQLIWSIGGPRDKGVFGEPRGIAFDRKGDLVVACHKEIGCLQILDIDI